MKTIQKCALVFATSSALALTLLATPARAEVVRAGTWPDKDAAITMDFDGTKEDALKKLAEVSGLSLVSNLELSAKPVHLKLKNVPASAALDAILEGEPTVVAKRQGNLLTLSISAAAQTKDATGGANTITQTETSDAAAPKVEAAVAEPHRRTGRDLNMRGQSLVIKRGETYRDVTIIGGSVDVFGQVTGDISVTGGKLNIKEGAVVLGDATAIGGSLHVEKNARIDGDVGVVGGIYTRDDGAIIKGDVSRMSSDDDDHESESHSSRSWFSRAASAVSRAFSLFALLFVLGCVLMPLAGDKMEKLRSEVALRPMRMFATGALFAIGASLFLGFLCITVIGIPFAVIASLALILGVFAGQVALASVVGEALIRHKTQNPYVHLAVGAGIFAALQLVPWIGTLATVVACCIAMGTLYENRATLGFRKGNLAPLGNGPYRSS
jgi:hypothetical protein